MLTGRIWRGKGDKGWAKCVRRRGRGAWLVIKEPIGGADVAAGDRGLAGYEAGKI